MVGRWVHQKQVPQWKIEVIEEWWVIGDQEVEDWRYQSCYQLGTGTPRVSQWAQKLFLSRLRLAALSFRSEKMKFRISCRLDPDADLGVFRCGECGSLPRKSQLLLDFEFPTRDFLDHD